MADEKSENSEQAARESGVINFNVEAVRLGDHIVRGTAADGQVRAFAVTARASVQELHERHQTSPVVSAALGRLLMAGMMMGAMSKHNDLQGVSPCRAEDAWACGWTGCCCGG